MRRRPNCDSNGLMPKPALPVVIPVVSRVLFHKHLFASQQRTMANVHGLFSSKKKDDKDDDAEEEDENTRFVGGIGDHGGGRYVVHMNSKDMK